MKFMKLGSKPDSFHSDGNDVRFVASELATDLTVHVGDVKFYLHKFPLLSKSSCLQKLVATTNEENDEEIRIPDIPGGAQTFEVCTKFCYGMTVTLNAYNVVAARCAAEYLGMWESVEKGNLIYKIEVFLNSSIFRSWKDSIIVLQSTRSFTPWAKELKIIDRCVESIASKASIETSMVQWSYTYNRKKLKSENGIEPQWNGVHKQHTVPGDWWVEDLCELDMDLFKRVIVAIKMKGQATNRVIGEASRTYAYRQLPGFGEGLAQVSDTLKARSLVEIIAWLLPTERGSVSCSFLLRLLKAASLLDTGEMAKRELVKKIGRQLEEASVKDLLIPASEGENVMYNLGLVRCIFEEFLVQDLSARSNLSEDGELEEIQSPHHVTDAAKLAVAKIMDGYLAEIAQDPNLPLSSFLDLAEMISSEARLVHDGIYHAIDMYLKEHPDLDKGEKKSICRLMDCKKLSMDASIHAAQNERLPLRVVVQVLFFKQARSGATAACGPDLPGNKHDLLPQEKGDSNGSSRSTTTNAEEDWEGAPLPEQLKMGFTSMRLSEEAQEKSSDDQKGGGKSKTGIFKPKKILNKLWSAKGSQQGESNSSDTSKSPGSGSANPDETKSTPSRNRRHSVS